MLVKLPNADEDHLYVNPEHVTAIISAPAKGWAVKLLGIDKWIDLDEYDMETLAKAGIIKEENEH